MNSSALDKDMAPIPAANEERKEKELPFIKGVSGAGHGARA